MKPHATALPGATAPSFRQALIRFCRWTLVLLVLAACKKEDNPPVPFFSGLLDGQAFFWKEAPGSIENQASSGFGNDCSATGILIYQQSKFERSGSNEKLLFALSTCVDLGDQPDAHMFDAIHVGGFVFGNVLETADVVQVIYIDSAGVTWSSAAGAASQAGSTFELTGVGGSGSTEAVYGLTGKVGCRLYNPQGQEKLLTSGEFYARAGIVPPI